MSRLIVKNLPSGIKEEKLRRHFEKYGLITDCCLKFTKTGQFRKFGFIGYKNAKEAEAALTQCNNTYINTSKIQVEFAKDLGDTNKPRAWSKYAQENTSKPQQDVHSGTDQSEETSKKKKKKKKKEEDNVVDELLGELKDDPKFKEFLDTHQNVSSKPVWTNDGSQATAKGDKTRKDIQKSMSDLPLSGADDSSEDETVEMEDEEEEKSDNEAKEEDNKAAKKKGLSDLDYLKSKVADQTLLSDNESDESESEKASDSEEEEMVAGENNNKGPKESKEKVADMEEEQIEPATVYMLDLKGLPSNCGEKAVREFFKPLEVIQLKVPKNAKKKPLGIAHVGFKTKNDLKQALRRNKNFIGGKRVYLRKGMSELKTENPGEKRRPWELKTSQDTEEVDGIAETGRLFIRNLSYSCTEEDLEEEFKKFGPLTEVNMPIDSLTKKVKGFAFVTYMMPEHAVKAFTELDGKVFQGRMLHILPGKEKKEEEVRSTEKSSYKKEQEKKKKAQAGSSHNWNSLFLGANAVADVLAEKYKASKRDILDTDVKGSLGVRMALGETQIVSETREFLLENGVALDSFSKPTAARSKTVILVKNLPAKTAMIDISDLFAKYGTLGRVLLPPSGVTAIVEFIAPTEARSAFTKLAYTKFQSVPLYLEWAPMEVFTSPTPTADPTDTTSDGQAQQQKDAENVKEAENQWEEDVVGSTLFVKNLNFDSTDDQLKALFDRCSKVRTANVARKKDVKNPGSYLSMGYGFVEFVSQKGAEKAVKEMQYVKLDGHKLELKISHRATPSTSKEMAPSGQKQQEEGGHQQPTTKILVRNIPFEAKRGEIEELFKVFGELKTVRLPKKLTGTGTHRGFAFVDFLTKQDAKRAFEALCHSTHLFGRRLVLEWAKVEDDIDDIRKRTTDHFHEGGRPKKFTKTNLKESLEMTMDL